MTLQLEHAQLLLRDPADPRPPVSYLMVCDRAVALHPATLALPAVTQAALKAPLARVRAVLPGSTTCLEIIGVGPAHHAGIHANVRRALGVALADARSQRLPALDIELDAICEDAARAALLHEQLVEGLGLALYSYKSRAQGHTQEASDTQSGQADASRGAKTGNGPGARSDAVAVAVAAAAASSAASGPIARNDTHRFESIDVRLPALAPDSHPQMRASAERGARSADALNFARTLGDTPANALPPVALAQAACERLMPLMKTHIITFDELKARGFGGIVAVGQGSSNKPCLAVFDFTPQDAPPAQTIVLVGKGLTFDTGGYSIKPKAHHDEMKYDMCGAANVVAALEILVRERPRARIVGLLGCAENMVSENAQRPGDVYTAYNGKKVEVFNTDAEGRLVLGDVLAFAGTFSPDVVIDIATLTGGASAIAGNMAGVVCLSDEKLLPEVRAASEISGEKFVHLEILPEAASDLKSLVADYTNMHNRWGTGAPTMYASAFLKEFVPEGADWIHLDIANTAWNGRDNGYMSTQGANAFGARTMVALVRRRLAAR